MAAKDVIGFAAQQQVIGFVQGAHQTHDCATSLSITKIRDAAAEVEPSLVSSWAAPGPCMTPSSDTLAVAMIFLILPPLGCVARVQAAYVSVIVGGQTVPLVSSDLPPVNGRTSTE
jgi:hypothetical protein